MFCSNCGKKFDEKALFCGICGEKRNKLSEEIQEKSLKNQEGNETINQKNIEKLAVLTNGNDINNRSIKVKYFSMKGRLNRKEYLVRSLFVAIVFLILNIVIYFIAAKAKGESMMIFVSILSIVSVIPNLISSISLSIRRAHDLDKKGKYLLLQLIPIVNIYIGLVLIFKKGTEGNNRFGEDLLQIN